MKLFKSILVLFLFLFIFASVASAKPTLNWTAVADTATCTIAGYIVHQSSDDGLTWYTKDVGNVTSVDLAPFGIKVNDQFAVSAYSTSKMEGPKSEVVIYDGYSIPGKVNGINIRMEDLE